jgi:hypothetical protein
MAKKRLKKKQPIDIRTLTTWTSVAAFIILITMAALTTWFVWTSLNGFGKVPDRTDLMAEDDEDIDTVNTLLLNSVGESLDDKTDVPITNQDQLPNPFTIRTPDPVPDPEPLTPDPDSATTEPNPESPADPAG